MCDKRLFEKSSFCPRPGICYTDIIIKTHARIILIIW